MSRLDPDAPRRRLLGVVNPHATAVTDRLRDIVLRAYRERTAATEAALRTLFELPATLHQYLAGVRDPSLVSPDAWQHAQWGMDRLGNKEIQFALHSNYGSNVECYDDWHAYFRAHLPRTLIVWGEGDPVFAPAGAHAYRIDLPSAELHMLDAGHFALETNAVEIAAYVRAFLPG